MLAKEIAVMQKRGYSLEQISDTLRDGGFDITTPTLRSYLQRTKDKSKKKKPAKKGTLTPPPPTPKPSPSHDGFTIRPDRERL